MGVRAFTAILIVWFAADAAQSFPEERPRVFPGAHGFGVRTQAGRGGRVLRVSNLNADGPGSLREALAAKGARLIVFEVGGVIDLQGRGIVLNEPNVTLAGQTAPLPGITLIRGGILIKTHDVLLRHIRVRPGDAVKPGPNGEPEIGTWGPEAYNVVIDHCSMSWASEDNLAISGPRYDGPQGTSRNITISHSILSEALRGAHGRPAGSYGLLVNDGCTNVALIGNLHAGNYQGNPAFRANTTGIIVNNVIYNPGKAAIQLDWPPGDWVGRPLPSNPRVSVVGNVMIHGADTVEGLALISRKGDVYLADNLAFDRSGTPTAITAGLINVLAERPSWARGLFPIPAAKVVEAVLRQAGARPRERDDVDRRVLADVKDHKGHQVASQDDVGGYPKPAMTRRRLIVPSEDQDEWLAKLAAEVE